MATPSRADGQAAGAGAADVRVSVAVGALGGADGPADTGTEGAGAVVPVGGAGAVTVGAVTVGMAAVGAVAVGAVAVGAIAIGVSEPPHPPSTATASSAPPASAVGRAGICHTGASC